ncbi:hypothetical protein ABEB36_002249 [Hypothenemus hampei]|uniref:Mutator-like transposase domain-containing protein n=1 Tax=Hypothenemus hampei TaxID=57062 RepID=A0ABD1F524_HYPHA
MVLGKKEDSTRFLEPQRLLEHKDICSINHKGSAGKMKVDAVKEMFTRSVVKHGVKYARYIGDGDSKTFKGILDVNPYGGDLLVEKKECVGHVQKRMGSRLRKVKKEKGLGGKGVESVEDMKNSVWATYYHKSSTDDKPQHQYCPSGPSSWCKWQQAVADDRAENYVHEQPPLDDKILEAMKPIYENLSSEDLLRRCLGAETQNNNESLNSLIWTFAPKHIHAGPQTVEIANYIAVCIFNEGFLPILQIFSTMGIKIGHNAFVFAQQRDNTRIDRSERRVSYASMEARTARRSERASENSQFEVEEGTLYEAGIAD